MSLILQHFTLSGCVLGCSLEFAGASGQHIRDNAIKDRTNKKHLVFISGIT